MSSKHRSLLAIGVGAVLTAYLACVAVLQPAEPHRGAALPATADAPDDGGALPVDGPSMTGSRRESGAIAPVPRPATVDEVLDLLNADLGDEGVPVDRQEIEEALRTDPELGSALGVR